MASPLLPEPLHARGRVFKDKIKEDHIRYFEAIIVGRSD